MEVDPATMRELLAKQERLATGSDEMKPQARATVQMSKDEILGLREACADEPAAEEARPNRTTNLGLEPIKWRRPATVVPRPPSTLVIIVALACAGMLSLAVALLAVR